MPLGLPRASVPVTTDRLRVRGVPITSRANVCGCGASAHWRGGYDRLTTSCMCAKSFGWIERSMGEVP